jgi:hypothetical protein
MTTLTSANAIIQIGVALIFPNPVQLQQFSTDNIYGVGNIKPNVTKMGVDGVMSAGKIWVEIPVTYHLMANSPSCQMFDTWKQAEDSAVDSLMANGLIALPGLGQKFSLINGSLTDFTPAPPAGQTLNERTFQITWNKIIPAPFS